MAKDFEQILKEKNKDELKVICRKLSLKGFSKLSIGRLRKLILENKNSPSFKKALGIKPPFLFRRDVLLTLIGIVASYFMGYYFLVIAQKDSMETKEIITKTIENKFKPVEELTETVKKIYKSDVEYTEYIREQEELNNLLLENIFGHDFQVFGQRNNHLFKNSTQFNSQIFSNEKEYTLIIDFSEIKVGKSEGISLQNMPFIIPFDMIKKGKIFPIVRGVGGKTLCILLLNNDLINPIWAIGFK